MYVVVFVDHGDVVAVSYSENRQEIEQRAFVIANTNGFFTERTGEEARKDIRDDHRITPDNDSDKLVVIKKAWRA